MRLGLGSGRACVCVCAGFRSGKSRGGLSQIHSQLRGRRHVRYGRHPSDHARVKMRICMSKEHQETSVPLLTPLSPPHPAAPSSQWTVLQPRRIALRRFAAVVVYETQVSLRSCLGAALGFCRRLELGRGPEISTGEGLCPSSANVGQARPVSSRRRPGLGEFRAIGPVLGQLRSNMGITFDRHRATSVEFGQWLAAAVSTSATFRTDSALRSGRPAQASTTTRHGFNIVPILPMRQRFGATWTLLRCLLTLSMTTDIEAAGASMCHRVAELFQ